MAKKYPAPTKKDPESSSNLQNLKTRLSVAKKYEEPQRKWWKKVNQVLEFKREVLIGTDSQSQKIAYPLLWAAYDNYLSNLSTTPPQTVIEASGREDSIKKIYWKGVLDYVKRKIRIEDAKEPFVDSFIRTGKAIYKVGRRVETKKEKKITVAPNGEKIEQEFEAIIRNESFIEVIDPRKIWLSPETKYQGVLLGEECPYVIEEMIKTPKYIEDMYGVTVDEDEKEIIDPDDDPDNKGRADGHTRDADYNEDDLKRVRVYMYSGVWDIEGQEEKNAQVLFTSKRILKARKCPYDHHKKPYIYALAFPKFFKAQAHSPLNPVLDLDQEYNENMNKVRTILRRLASPKWVKLKGTQVDETALLDPDIGVIVEESQPNAFRPLEGPKVDPVLIDKATTVEQLFQLITGIVYGSTAIKNAGTATGQDIVQQGADVKEGRLTRILERSQEELEIMLLQLEQQYTSGEPMDIRITGAETIQQVKNKKHLYQVQMQLFVQQQERAQMGEQIGAPVEEPMDEYQNFEITEDGKAVVTSYTKEDIEGEFELTVVSQSSSRSNKAVQAQQTINAIQAANPMEQHIRNALWKRLFTNYGWDELVDIVDQPTLPAGAQPMPPTGPGGGPTTEAGISGQVQAQGRQTV